MQDTINKQGRKLNTNKQIITYLEEELDNCQNTHLNSN